MPNTLTHKQTLFVNEYLTDGNATRSAVSAGYSAKNAESIGCRLVKNPHVAAELARRRLPIQRKHDLTADRVMQELANIALLDPKDLYDADGKPRAINEMPEDARRAISSLTDKGIKTHSKLGALELVAKLLGMVKQEQTQSNSVTITIGPPPEIHLPGLDRPPLRPEW